MEKLLSTPFLIWGESGTKQGNMGHPHQTSPMGAAFSRAIRRRLANIWPMTPGHLQTRHRGCYIDLDSMI